MSTTDVEQENLAHMLQEKIDTGTSFLADLAVITVPGTTKLAKKIKQELKFLKKLQQSPFLKKEQVLCSNMQHLQAISQSVCQCNDLVAILYPFSYKDNDVWKRIIVDIVADHGRQWIKVVTRNPKALHLLSFGDGEYGQRSILDSAAEYLFCANQHPNLLTPPEVVIIFVNGVSEALAQTLEDMSVRVKGERLANDKLDVACGLENHKLSSSEDKSVHELAQTDNVIICPELMSISQTLNLDITALIGYVSSLTNGSCKWRFQEPVLSKQALWERERPLKPVLDKLFAGRDLYCCRSAVTDFQRIIDTIGGKHEKLRARSLLNRVTVIEDCLSNRAQNLSVRGKVKPRSLAIFGTGDKIGAITVTANVHFVRAAKGQGVNFAVFLHESRALTEAKEATAEETE